MKEFFTRNLGLKLLSILFAVGLWFFVNLKATEERVLPFPVQFRSLPGFLEITNPVNESVRVRVTGPRRILTNLDPKDFPVVLDLTDAKPGLMNYQITDKMITLIPGLRAEVLPPDTVQFKFELIVTREVAVKPNVVGDPPAGYALGKVKVHPDRVEVTGAQSELIGLEQVETGVVDVSRLRKDETVKVKIETDRPHVRPSPGHEYVEVSVVIKELEIGAWFRNVQVLVESQEEDSVTANPPRVDVYLRGPAGKIQDVKAEDLQAFAQFPRGQPGTASVAVQLRPVAKGVQSETRPAKVVLTKKKTEKH